MSSNKYFMPVFLTTESCTETLMVTPLHSAEVDFVLKIPE